MTPWQWHWLQVEWQRLRHEPLAEDPHLSTMKQHQIVPSVWQHELQEQ